jgi:hypothetical protein
MRSVSRNPEFAIFSAKKLGGEINRRLDEMTQAAQQTKMWRPYRTGIVVLLFCVWFIGGSLFCAAV